MAADKRTEKEKMLAGELYCAFEKTLLDERQVRNCALASSMLSPRLATAGLLGVLQQLHTQVESRTQLAYFQVIHPAAQ